MSVKKKNSDYGRQNLKMLDQVYTVLNLEIAPYLQASELLNYCIALMNKGNGHDFLDQVSLSITLLNRWIKNFSSNQPIYLISSSLIKITLLLSYSRIDKKGIKNLVVDTMISVPVTMKLMQRYILTVKSLYSCVKCKENGLNTFYTQLGEFIGSNIPASPIPVLITSCSAHLKTKAFINYKTSAHGDYIEADGSECKCSDLECGLMSCLTCNPAPFSRCEFCKFTLCSACIVKYEIRDDDEGIVNCRECGCIYCLSCQDWTECGACNSCYCENCAYRINFCSTCQEESCDHCKVSSFCERCEETICPNCQEKDDANLRETCDRCDYSICNRCQCNSNAYISSCDKCNTSICQVTSSIHAFTFSLLIKEKLFTYTIIICRFADIRTSTTTSHFVRIATHPSARLTQLHSRTGTYTLILSDETDAHLIIQSKILPY